MDAVLHDLLEILRTVGGDDVRLIGGLAVRLFVGEDSRVTRDIDLVALTAEAHGRVLSHLRACGYRIGVSGGWHRAAMPASSRPFVDLAGHPVVNPQTFEEVTIRGVPTPHTIDGVTVPIAAADDLAVLKLAAHRDQDIIDVLLLAGRVSAAGIAAAAAHDDIERTIAEGAQTARLLMANGGLDSIAEELLGKSTTSDQRQTFAALLRDLEKEGL